MADEYHEHERDSEDFKKTEAAKAARKVANKEIFDAADLNSDGSLDRAEYELYRDPYTHAATKKVLFARTLAKMDADKDGKITEAEFTALRLLPTDAEWLTKFKKSQGAAEYSKLLARLDLNKDGAIDGDEVLEWNRPKPGINEADHLMKVCDANKDGKISISELINNHSLWLKSETTHFGQKAVDEL